MDCVVVGAGVVGLAIARRLALAGREVLVLEAAEAIGTETSSRNSEVIHAGIYYPKGSLMATSCVVGKQMLYQYCEERGVPHRRCGKLIVATNAEERDKLASIQARAAANGVPDLRLLSSAEAVELEPAVACTAALLSPSTGIIDSHAYMLALQGDAENAGAAFVFHSPVVGGRLLPEGGAELEVGGAEPMALRCSLLINAAGLHAPRLARALEGLPAEFIPSAYYAKGNYFTLTGRSPFTRLIYPVPVPGGLGTHLTIDLGGQCRFGPDVEWIPSISYDVDPRRGKSFYAAIRRYWPSLPDEALQPGYSGIRPKITGPGEAAQDFVVQGPALHGRSGLVNLFGIESPGLTASLALAEHVHGLAR
ncbi:NAD(P)/FAD-dependent oxidoreductase [Teichococcus globiformis]